MRYVGAEGDPAEAFAADGLLLDVDRFAVGVVATDVDRAGAASWPDTVPSHVPVPSDHVDIIAERLEVIRDTVARNFATVV